jgi:serine/threonine protein phosphatase 1
MLLERFSPNRFGRDFVVGDLHGHYDALLAALARVGFDKSKDRLFGLGDLIDRGPDSLKCLRLVHESWFVSVLGNHELFMQNALLTRDPGNKWLRNWLANGGDWIIHVDVKELTQIARGCLPQMPYAIELPVGGKRLGIVHAEPPELGWGVLTTLVAEHDEELLQEVATRMTWSRARIRTEDARPILDIDAVVCGHTIVSEPRRLGNVGYIDTGVYRDEGRLTVMDARAIVEMCSGR